MRYHGQTRGTRQQIGPGTRSLEPDQVACRPGIAVTDPAAGGLQRDPPGRATVDRADTRSYETPHMTRPRTSLVALAEPSRWPAFPALDPRRPRPPRRVGRRSRSAIVPRPPEPNPDVMARIVFDQVSQQLGQPIIVENRPGAGNSIGMNAVAKADPDGYTILVNSSSHTVTPAIRATMPLDTDTTSPPSSRSATCRSSSCSTRAKATKSSATSWPGPRPIPARPTIRRRARAIRPISMASCFGSLAVSMRCTCHSRARPRR